MPVLTMVDVLKIQEYVFDSNRLRDIVGGSALLNKVMTLDYGNSNWASSYRDNILVGAGGNLLLRFDRIDQAHRFAAEFTYNLQRFIPSLETVVVHRSYSDGSLADTVLEIQTEMQIAKTERIPKIPLMNLGVAEICRETGLPAAEFDEEGRPITQHTNERNKVAKTESYWDRFLPSDALDLGGPTPIRLRFPSQIDELGRTQGERSLIGIVYVDGNGMGHKINEWISRCADEQLDDETFSSEYRKMSRAITGNMDATIKELIQRVKNRITWDTECGRYLLSGQHGQFYLYTDSDALLLPIRPVIAGGDDMTFICDGRIALDLASFAIKHYGKQRVSGIGNVAACAGVHIVRSHTPIIRAYKLAESLCRNAKTLVKTIADAGMSVEGAEAAVDWHIARSGSVEKLEVIRQRQYNTPDSTLTMRPYILGLSSKSDPGTWYWLRDKVLGGEGFLSPTWQDRWNKVKKLPELARAGQEKLGKTLSAWGASLPGNLNQGFLSVQWIEKQCTPLLDAVEIADLFLNLEPQINTGGDVK